MTTFVPTIKDIYSVNEWAETPRPHLTCVNLEISNNDSDVNIFYLYVPNIPWLLENLRDIRIHKSGYWLPERGYLYVDPLNLNVLRQIIEDKITENGPYRSLRQFASKMRNYIIWEIEGSEELQSRLPR
jgi:hypothetical protein